MFKFSADLSRSYPDSRRDAQATRRRKCDFPFPSPMTIRVFGCHSRRRDSARDFWRAQNTRASLREWQINCEPRVDGLIRLSRRYKRLSRSNSILRFWLSHPTDPRPVSLPPRRASARHHPCPSVHPVYRVQFTPAAPSPPPKRFLSPSRHSCRQNCERRTFENRI